jgi:hypothetical protein
LDMQDLPAETPKDLAKKPGFIVVEDDDVSFAVALCREIHRMYGMYQADELPATDSVEHGLMLTMEMFSTLQNSVTDGMPALRLQVGAAQAREMLGTLFSYDLPTRRSRELAPDGHRGRPHRTSRSLASHPRHETSRPSPRLPQGAHKELVEIAPARSAERTVAAPEVPPTPGVPPTPEAPVGAITTEPSSPGRLARYWDRQPLPIQVVATLVGIVVGASLLDAPFAIVALFPNDLFPLVAAFIGVFVVSRCAHWIRSSRKAGSA